MPITQISIVAAVLALAAGLLLYRRVLSAPTSNARAQEIAAAIQAGAEAVKIHGQYVPVRAEVVSMASLSAHADAGEILGWLGGFTRAPRHTFIVHGEPVSADALRHRIEEEKGWACAVPDYREEFVLQ